MRQYFVAEKLTQLNETLACAAPFAIAVFDFIVTVACTSRNARLDARTQDEQKSALSV